MTTSRRIALDELGVGDLFHAEYPNGGVLVGLILEVTATRIRGRDITRQEVLDIDRKTGVSIPGDDGISCTVFSTEQLPPELYEALMGLDRKYGSGREPTEEESKLTPAEKKALILIRP